MFNVCGWLSQTAWHQKLPDIKSGRLSDDRDEKLLAEVFAVCSLQEWQVQNTLLLKEQIIRRLLVLRYDKRILLEELCPGELISSIFFFHIFSSLAVTFSQSQSVLLRLVNNYQCANQKLCKACCSRGAAGMAYKPRGPPEVEKNRQKPRRVGLCEKYHRSDQSDNAGEKIDQFYGKKVTL